MLILMNISLILRSLLYPLISVLSLFIRPLRERRSFEMRNSRLASSESFNRVGKRAEIAFHFSSEGELEIIRPIIDQCLAQGHLIELLFTSLSVEAKVVKLCELYPEKVRSFRMPLLTFFPFFFGQNNYRWLSSKKLMMVRYDFLPELICLRPFLEKFILFAASAKSSSNHDWRFFFKKGLYQVFDDLFPTTKEDHQFFLDEFRGTRLRVHGPSELRSIQINKRQVQFNFHANGVHKVLHDLITLNERRMIIAQLWPAELPFLNSSRFIEEIRTGDTLCYIAPHRFDSGFVSEIREGLMKIFGASTPIYMIEKTSCAEDILSILKAYQNKPGPILSCVPGILCELYPLFKKSYIGGGLGKGVHSLLEPFVAGNSIACAHNVKRSTEYDIAKSLGHEITIVDSAKKFEDFVFSPLHKEVDITHFIEENEKSLLGLLRLLEISHA